jgi:hypothetical protein
MVTRYFRLIASEPVYEDLSFVFPGPRKCPERFQHIVIPNKISKRAFELLGARLRSDQSIILFSSHLSLRIGRRVTTSASQPDELLVCVKTVLLLTRCTVQRLPEADVL